MERSKPHPLSLHIEPPFAIDPRNLRDVLSAGGDFQRLKGLTVRMTPSALVGQIGKFLISFLQSQDFGNLELVQVLGHQGFWDPTVDDSACVDALKTYLPPTLDRFALQPSRCEVMHSWKLTNVTQFSFRWQETLQQTFQLDSLLFFLNEAVKLVQIRLDINLMPEEDADAVHVRDKGIRVTLPEVHTFILVVTSKCSCALTRVIASISTPHVTKFVLNVVSWSRLEYGDEVEKHFFPDHVDHSIRFDAFRDWCQLALRGRQGFALLEDLELFERRLRESVFVGAAPRFEALDIASAEYPKLLRVRAESRGFQEDICVEIRKP